MPSWSRDCWSGSPDGAPSWPVPGGRRAGLSSFTEEMARRGLLAESQTLVARREQAGPGVARALDLTEGDAVIHWRRLRRADSVPMCIEDAYLNEVLIPGFLQTGMPTSLYDALEARGLRPTWAEDSVSADVATERGGRRCSRSTAGAPVLRHSRRGLCGERIVEVSRTVFRADRYTLFVQLGARAEPGSGRRRQQQPCLGGGHRGALGEPAQLDRTLDELGVAGDRAPPG